MKTLQSNRRPKSIRLASERGSLTIDYLFALILVLGFGAVVMAFSTTLATVEVVQYAAFAGARRFFAGNDNFGDQANAAQSAISTVLNNQFIAPLLANGWFTASAPVICGGPNSNNLPICSKFERYGGGEQGPYGTFEGVIIPFQANLLDFHVPFFGSTVKSGTSGAKQTFQVNINSFLGREPSFQECRQYWEDRWANIQKLGYHLPAGANASTTKVLVELDNGC